MDGLTVQCTKISKRTRQRCGQLVPGGGPNAACRWHGGGTKAATAQREARLAVAEARVLFQDRYEPREWHEALRAAGQVVDQVARYLQDKIELAEYPSVADLDALVIVAEKAARMAKLIQDSGLDERRARLDEATATLIFDVIQGVVLDLGHHLTDQRVQKVLVSRLTPLTAGASS